MFTCEHLSQAGDAAPRSPDGCEECLAIDSGWVHLRTCVTCGHVGCCDSSPHQHAMAHFKESTHPVVRSAQPGEKWRWCYLDEVLG